MHPSAPSSFLCSLAVLSSVFLYHTGCSGSETEPSEHGQNLCYFPPSGCFSPVFVSKRLTHSSSPLLTLHAHWPPPPSSSPPTPCPGPHTPRAVPVPGALPELPVFGILPKPLFFRQVRSLFLLCSISISKALVAMSGIYSLSSERPLRCQT